MPNGLAAVGYGPGNVHQLVAGTLPQHTVTKPSPYSSSEAGVLESSAPMRTTLDTGSRPTLFALTFGHLCVDLCSGALWALLPFLAVERHYSYAQAGVFALTASVTHALFQPVVGAQGDRWEARWLLSAGLALTGLGIAAVGFAQSFPLTLAAVAVCSAGQMLCAVVVSPTFSEALGA